MRLFLESSYISKSVVSARLPWLAGQAESIQKRMQSKVSTNMGAGAESRDSTLAASAMLPAFDMTCRQPVSAAAGQPLTARHGKPLSAAAAGVHAAGCPAGEGKE